MIHSKKRQKAQKNTGSYYPFGIQQKGYNTNVSPSGNALAQQFGYNGYSINSLKNTKWIPYTDPRAGLWDNIVGIPESSATSTIILR